MRVYLEADADQRLIRGRKVAILGYGNQGRAQALNLRDSGVDPLIGLEPGSASLAQAQKDGFAPLESKEAAERADLLVMLVPDEKMRAVFERHVAPALQPGQALAFAHGFAIRFGEIVPPAGIDVILVAPKGPGSALRALYESGEGMLGLFAVHQDASGSARALALAYGAAIGCARKGLIETGFAEECEADLFNEAAVIWGAVPELIQAGFETLVEAGYSPEIAFLECQTELKLLAGLIDERGIAGMREAISNTAEFGALAGGARIVDEATRKEMRAILEEVRSGALAAEMIADARAGSPRLKASRQKAREHRIEEVRRGLS